MLSNELFSNTFANKIYSYNLQLFLKLIGIPSLKSCDGDNKDEDDEEEHGGDVNIFPSFPVWFLDTLALPVTLVPQCPYTLHIGSI